jgi:hypothetical protein
MLLLRFPVPGYQPYRVSGAASRLAGNVGEAYKKSSVNKREVPLS